MKEKETVYLAGKITGDPMYFSKFCTAQKKLEEFGFIVINPALLPADGFTYEEYIRMSSAMLRECEAACFLPDWKESEGAQFEYGQATIQGKRILMFEEVEANKMQNNKLPLPTEAQEQMTLFNWARMQSGKYPELELLYHVPNGGSRHKAEAGRLKAEGVKAGVPDLCLPVARGGCHGLYVELKRLRGERTSEEQKKWIEALMKQGYSVAICKGWKVAAEVILNYLEGKNDGKKTNSTIR